MKITLSKAIRAGTAVIVTAGAVAASACDRDDLDPTAATSARSTSAGGPRPALQNRSVTPALVKSTLPDVKAYSLISSDDVLPDSPEYVFGGSADGSGLLTNPDGSYTIVVNHEDNFSVSRVTLDRNLVPRKGEYIVNSNHGLWRLCSSSMIRPEEHGFGPLYITAGETGPESQIHAVDPYGAPNTNRLLPALGFWNTENAVPLPQKAFPGRTVVVIGDDDSGPFGGQVALYVGQGIGDLDNGSLYVMTREDGVTRERDIVVGGKYPVVFKPIDARLPDASGSLNTQAAAAGAIAFGRVEDIDYRKTGPGREIYFNVTGQNNTGVNADFSRTKYGRVYRLTLGAQDPTRGVLEVLLDGDDRTGPAGTFQNVDNILVTRHYAYISEDPNGYGDETHDAYLYQYDLVSGDLKVVFELDHRRGDAYYGATTTRGNWEYGAMIDISDQVGGNGADGTFLLSIQPHTWRGPKYLAVDGGTLRPAEDQASELAVVTGLPR